MPPGIYLQVKSVAVCMGVRSPLRPTSNCLFQRRIRISRTERRICRTSLFEGFIGLMRRPHRGNLQLADTAQQLD